MLMDQVRAHGGQGASAGQIESWSQVHAILRGTTRTVRVWNGVAGKREEFTVEEATAMCVAGDRALMAADRGSGYARGFTSLWIPVGDERARVLELSVSRRWLVAFLAAVRGALRTFDAANAMAKATH